MDYKMIEHKISSNDRQVWFLNGFYHREDGPAVIDEFLGVKEWRINGQLHREDGPAIIWEDGTQLWYQNGIQYDRILNKISFNINTNHNIKNGF